MSERLREYLEHMAIAASDACGFVDGMSKSDFLGDKRTQQAVIMSLVIIGEAATKVMDRYSGFMDRHVEIPWRSMRGMRNRVAHGYFEIDVEMVWETVQTALPDLLDKLDGIPELPAKEDDSNSV
jgi:uncharacterized protein with HEPN domain